MRAITICVGFHDYANLTIPYNRRHFSDVMIVTTEEDTKTIEVARANNCSVYTTNSFYANGAKFAKFLALEEALSIFGRKCIDPKDNWICQLDIDVLWPSYLKIDTYEDRVEYKTPSSIFLQEKNYLVSPLRHMMEEFPTPLTKEKLPDESIWDRYKIHRNVREYAGYSQVYNMLDKHLPNNPPWHDTSFCHCGGADSFFQALWPREYKLRPNFNCLHIGEPGISWYGRASDYLDGTKNPQGKQLRSEILAMWARRHRLKRLQAKDPTIDEFYPERIHKEKTKGEVYYGEIF